MSKKSYVSLGYTVCPACGNENEDSVLLDRRLKNSLEQRTFTGFVICDDCKAMSEEYLTLIETTADPNTDKDARLTGNVLRIKWEAAKIAFNNLDESQPFAYVEKGVIARIQEMVHES